MRTQQVSHEPRLALISIVSKPVIAHCPQQGCRFAASARSDGRVLRALATHLVRAHQAQKGH